METRTSYLEAAKVLGVLADTIAIRSVSGEEAQLARYIQRQLRDGGLDADIDRHGNVILSWEMGPGPTLVLNTHMDTVPPDGSWTRNPFTPDVVDGRLYGLGAADTKGSLAAMVCALCALREQKLKLQGRIVLTVVVAEEVPNVQAKGTVLCLQDGLRGDIGICGEPTQMNVALGCEGTLEVEVRSRGRSAHACDPDKGVNAISTIVKFLSRLDRIVVAEHPLFGRGSVNVGRIEGGVKGTMVPASCHVRIGRFILPGESMDLFVRELETIADEVRLDDETAELTIDPVYASNAAIIDPAHPLVGTLARSIEAILRREAARVGVKYHADSDFMVHMGGIPTVLFGPGSIDQAHAPDEFVEIDQVIGAARVYTETIVELLGPCA